MAKQKAAAKTRNYLATEATRININALKRRVKALELRVAALEKKPSEQLFYTVDTSTT